MNPALTLTLLARVRAHVGDFIEAGQVPAGQRRVIPLTGGVVEGPGLRGEIVPLGADWNLVRADGSETVSARYLLRTDDGVLLSILNEGVITDRPQGRYGITSLRIEAPEDSRYAWLNDAVLAGSLGVEAGEAGLTIILEYWYAELAG